MACQLRRFSLLLFFVSVLLFFPHPSLATEFYHDYEVTVSASIGEPKLTLFGYSSPQSLIQLHGERVAEEVIAKDDGYFFFDRIFLPRPNPDYPELCLNAIDTQSRISFPICLPPLPTGPFNISVGPVLLPPTFNLEKGFFLPLEQVKAEGLTIPNSEVTVFLANDSRLRSRIVNIVHAHSLPQYQIKADEQGRFEFSLPTVKANNWRLFTAAEFQGAPTPKSNTLNFRILNWWQWLLLFLSNLLGAFWRFIRPFWWLLLICLEISLIVFLLFKIKLHSLR